MSIRPATDADVPALLPLIRGYCDFYEVDPPDEGLDEMAHALVAAPDAEGLLLCACDSGGAVVGFAACGWKWSSLRGARIVILEDLFVSPEARGRGHADELIEACADRARALGAPVMTWLTAPDNLRAQAVYNRVGGKPETFVEYELEL
jgi:GNAT superfamily N-acetyltransferase